MSPAGGPSETRRVHCRVAGHVQGVWYRASAQKTANELGLSGWVRNLADGRVELVAQGPPASVDRLVAWLGEGPPGSRVDEVAVEEESPSAVNGSFDVLY